MTAILLLASLTVAAVPSDTALVPLPLDVSAAARGAAAGAFDPAAAGRIDAAELQLRQRGHPNGRGMGGLGAFAALPLGAGVSLLAGYEWETLPDPAAERATLGISAQLSSSLRAGVAYRRVHRFGFAARGGVWDAGLLAEVSPYLSLSLGVDALNAPRQAPAVNLHRAARVGVALRPWRGEPWITLAADARLISAQRLADTDARALLDIMPVEGLHLVGAYGRPNGQGQVWGGLSVDVLGAGFFGASRLDNGVTGSGLDNSTFALTLKVRPSETLLGPIDRTVEVPLEGDLQHGDRGPFEPGKVISTAILDLDALAGNPAVGTVVLPIGPLKVGLGTVDELRAAIARLRAEGKEVVAELRGADNKAYMVAAAASRIRLDPLASINLKGFAVTSHYFAETLSKVGVRFDAVGVGKYKSGPDPLTRTTARPEDREVEGEILGLAYASLRRALEADRKLSPRQVQEIFETGLWDAREAVRIGLADEIVPDPDPSKIPHGPPAGEPFDATLTATPRWSSRPVVAIVPVVGAIVQNRGDNPLPGGSAEARWVVRQLEAAERDSEVAGVVLRINSPGGDVFASELIWRAVKRLAARKPLAVSMADVAASGGYYAAAPAPVIFAEPNTVTGSIGIFMVRPDVSGVLNLLGVHSETYEAGEHANWESIEHPLSDADRDRLHGSLEKLYTAFVARVADGRHLPEARVRELAEGRVYTGARAKELGLVDAVGGLPDAVRWVREHAGIDPQEVVDVTVPDRDLSLPDLVARMTAAQVSPLEALVADVQRRVTAWDGRALAVMPYRYEVEAR
jgi:protease-4